jgi:aspartate aminotransferase/aminotransferase
MITSGTSGGLLLAMLALVEAGDEVMFADPYFVMYKHLVNLIEGVPIFVNTYPDFRLTAERVERHISPRTKLLILNSPCNPTGAVLDSDTLGEIATLCNERGIRVITDEIYYSFCYDGPFASAFPFLEQGLLLDGFSKSHAMTGWRVGIAAGPRRVIQEMSKLQQYTFVCAPSMAQYAALAALEFDTAPLRDAYHRKRDLVCDGLSDLFEIAKPGGAFYAFPRAPGDDATAFVKKAIEHNVLIIPGNVFSERDSHFRISYAASDETIEQGIEVLRTLV